MNNKIIKFLFFRVLLFAIVSCGIGDDRSNSENQEGEALICETAPALLRGSEGHSFQWGLRDAHPNTRLEVYPGLTENYLDWGTVSQDGETSGRYTAPSFIPDSRKLDLALYSEGESTPIGTCPVYVLTDTTYGIEDDGLARGLVVKVYPVAVGTPTTSFPTLNGAPVETSVAYNLNISNVPVLTGITASTRYVAMVFTGTIELPTSNDYLFRLQANQLGNLYIDERLMVTVQNNNQANSGTLAYGLAAGKHTLRIEYLLTTATAFTLRLDWAVRATPTTFAPYSNVPYSAFGR